MTRQFPHPFASLDGHDRSKVRRDGEDQTIPARLREIVAQLADADASGSGPNWLTRARHYATVAAIADEIEDAARPPAPRTVAAIMHPIATASDLGSAWLDAAPSLHTLTTTERQQITEAFITRLCVISQDDGR